MSHQLPSRALRSLALRSLLAVLGAAALACGTLPITADGEPRVIGQTQKDVRVLRGPGATPVVGAPSATTPGNPSAADLEASAAPLFAPPPAPGDSAARVWAGRMIDAYGGPAALLDWIERGERRGVQVTNSPVRAEARVIERRSGARMRFDARIAGLDYTMVSTPEGDWQSLYGIVSDMPEQERDYVATLRSHDERLLLDVRRGTLPARIEPVTSAADTVALLVWGTRGSATRFRAARADGRLATIEFVDRSPEGGGDAMHLARLTDWRAVGPQRAPFRARHDGHVPGRMIEFVAGAPSGESTLDTLDLTTEIPAAMFSRPGAAPAPAGSPRRSILALERHGDHHFADVRFADRGPRRFLVDSGAAVTAVSRELAAELAIAPEESVDIAGVGGGATAQAALLPPFDLGSHRLSGVRGVVLDLSGLSAALGTSIDGVLGVSSFARFAVTWDFEHATLEIAESRDAQPSSSRGTRVPFTMAGGLVFAPVRVDGRAASDFVVDTGSWRTFLSGTLAGAVTNPPDRRLPGIPYAGIDGRAASTDALRLRSLEIGGLVVSRPIVLAPSLAGGKSDALGAMTRDRGVLGLDVLRRFRLTLDFPRQEMLLEPVPKAAPVDDAAIESFSGPGVVLEPAGREGAATVMRVMADSPAAGAGVRVGDLVTAIDDRKVGRATLRELADDLSGPAGTKVRLRVRSTKDGDERTLTLTRALLL